MPLYYQDYKVHRDEIHAKLVQIMKERLLVHLRALPQIAENWNKTEDTDPQPSQFARALTKEVGVLQRVLSRTLLEEDVIEIFRQVTEIFHSQLTEAFSKLDLNTPQAKKRLFRDIQHILACIHALPALKLSGESIPKPGKLDDFLAQRFQSEAGQ
ncbi:Vacuolar sorting-associated protein 54 [Nymphaea thermarum]|nr:Vacuolar sorting-associated protein 54 [Nymphaea thermarum]